MQSISYAQFLGRFHVKQKIGQGSFGQVFRLYDCETKSYMALKKITLRKNEDPYMILREIQIQNFLAHPLVLDIFEFYVHQAHDKHLGHRIQIGIISELGKHSLLKLIKQKSYEFSIDQIINFAFHFTKLFAFFQDQNIVHRDIKPENFVQMGPGLACKLIDFGLCSHVNDINGVAGSFFYLSPKLKKMHTHRQLRNKIKTNPYKDDVYSFGLTLYQLITRKTSQSKPNEVYSKYSSDVYNCTQNEKLAKIVEMMLEYEEDNRPDFHQLFKIFQKHWKFYEDDGQNQEEENARIRTKSSKAGYSKQKEDYSRRQRVQEQTQKTVRRHYNQCDNERTYHFREVQENEIEIDKSIYYVDPEFDEMRRNGHHAIHNRRQCANEESTVSNRQNERRYLQKEEGRQGLYHNSKTIEIDNCNNNQINNHQQDIENTKTEIIPNDDDISTTNEASLQPPPQQQKPLEFKRKNYTLPANIRVLSVVLIKEFIVCGCEDGSLQVVNISSTNKKNIYKIVGAESHQTAITFMTKDKMGRLWTVSLDGKVILWDRLKFFKHLIDQSYYREDEIEIINREGEKELVDRGLLEMEPTAGKVISIPEKFKQSGVNTLLCIDENHFAVGFNDGRMFVFWDNCQIQYRVQDAPITAIKLHENELYSSSLDGTIKVFSFKNFAMRKEFFTSKIEIRNFNVTGSQQKPSLLVITTDGKGYIRDDWQLPDDQVDETDSENVKITDALFAHENVFRLSSKGTVFRNADQMLKCEGDGWSCMFWDNNSSMVMGSTEGRLCLIQCE